MNFQVAVIEINHAIGAKGFKSMECKEIVSQYGEMIYDLLASGVSFFLPYTPLYFGF